ncbi:MAG: HPr family phosphocarrier protein [Faecalibacterium sp.]
MVTKMTMMNNPTGLHARPAAQLISFVKQFDCKVLIKNGDKTANASSIINLLTLGAVEGTSLEVICDGADEAKAAEEVATYIANIKD